MKACEGKIGRVFVMRLEDGDVVPECIERFAEEKGVSVGQAILVGGIGGGDVVVGPRRSEGMPPEPMRWWESACSPPVKMADRLCISMLRWGGQGRP